jgi:3-oxoacyl-[acyl-carrier-protein] synthase II
MGHLLGGAGAVEAAICALAVADGKVPPTLNLDKPDASVDLDFVPHEARERRVRHALSNSFGFGGTNAGRATSSADGASARRAPSASPPMSASRSRFPPW